MISVETSEHVCDISIQGFIRMSEIKIIVRHYAQTWLYQTAGPSFQSETLSGTLPPSQRQPVHSFLSLTPSSLPHWIPSVLLFLRLLSHFKSQSAFFFFLPRQARAPNPLPAEKASSPRWPGTFLFWFHPGPCPDRAEEGLRGSDGPLPECLPLSLFLLLLCVFQAQTRALPESLSCTEHADNEPLFAARCQLEGACVFFVFFYVCGTSESVQIGQDEGRGARGALPGVSSDCVHGQIDAVPIYVSLRGSRPVYRRIWQGSIQIAVSLRGRAGVWSVCACGLQKSLKPFPESPCSVLFRQRDDRAAQTSSKPEDNQKRGAWAGSRPDTTQAGFWGALTGFRGVCRRSFQRLMRRYLARLVLSRALLNPSDRTCQLPSLLSSLWFSVISLSVLTSDVWMEFAFDLSGGGFWKARLQTKSSICAVPTCARSPGFAVIETRKESCRVFPPFKKRAYIEGSRK